MIDSVKFRAVLRRPSPGIQAERLCSYNSKAVCAQTDANLNVVLLHIQVELHLSYNKYVEQLVDKYF